MVGAGKKRGGEGIHFSDPNNKRDFTLTVVF